jgi:hypothetical protein
MKSSVRGHNLCHAGNGQLVRRQEVDIVGYVGTKRGQTKRLQNRGSDEIVVVLEVYE